MPVSGLASKATNPKLDPVALDVLAQKDTIIGSERVRPLNKLDRLQPFKLLVDTKFRSERTSRSRKQLWDGQAIKTLPNDENARSD